MKRAALCLALVATALTAPAEAQERIVVWHAYDGAEQEGLRAAADAFERAHPGVSVALVPQPFGAYASKLESAIPTGNGPDLFIDAHDRVGSYARRGLVASIELTDADVGPMPLVHRRAFDVEEASYGVPLSLKCPLLFVNTGLVRGPIESLEDIEALELSGGQVALAMEARSAYWSAGLLGAYGAPLLSAEGEWGLRGEPAERGVAHLARLVRSGVVPEETSGDLVRRLFADGRAATAISGSFLTASLPDGLAWRPQPLPIVRAANGAAMRPYVTIEGAYVAEGASSAAWARRLALFLATGEGARLRAVVGGQVPTDQRVLDALPSDALRDAVRAAAEGGVVMPTHPHMRSVFGPADRAIRKVLRGTASVPDALREGERRFDDYTRPLPERRDPSSALLLIGLLLLGFVLFAVVRLRQAPVRARLRASLPAYAYVAHAAVAVGLLVLLPLAVGAATSLFAGHGAREMHYVGLANYADILAARGGELLAQGSFWLVLLVTVLWTALNIALHVALGVGLALLLHRPALKLKAAYRVLLIVPWAVPNYVTALAWRGMFHRQFGAVNAILDVFGVEPVSWFSHWTTAFSANVATNVWLGFPFMMVVTLGALTSIPKNVYEAAAVDGANAWQRFRHITAPLLVPHLAPAVAMGAVWTFNMFNVVFLVSAGEPDGGTEILVSEAYRWAFTRGNQYGYAAAYAVLIFVLLTIATRSAARARRRFA